MDINFDVNLDVNKVFQKRLAASMGLDKYQFIMEQVNQTDVSTDPKFQRTFNDFCRINGKRNEAWQKVYYEYFQNVKDGTPTFESILTYLYEHTKNIEPSFSSKMLATISRDKPKPIWDKYVLQNLNMKLVGTTKEKRLANAIKLYADLEKWYADFLQTDKAKEWIEAFDRAMPDYKDISDIKKIDFILWIIR